jgi:hypothetical protein
VLRLALRWRPQAPPPLAQARTSPKTAGGGWGCRWDWVRRHASSWRPQGPLPRPLPAQTPRGEGRIRTRYASRRGAPRHGVSFIPSPACGRGWRDDEPGEGPADASGMPAVDPGTSPTPISPADYGGSANPSRRRGRPRGAHRTAPARTHPPSPAAAEGGWMITRAVVRYSYSLFRTPAVPQSASSPPPASASSAASATRSFTARRRAWMRLEACGSKVRLVSSTVQVLLSGSTHSEVPV